MLINIIWENVRISLFSCFIQKPARLQRGTGVRTPNTPWQITLIKGFLAMLVRIPWTITKLPSQHWRLGHHWWWPAFEWFLDPLSPHQGKKSLKKSLKKLDTPTLSPHDETFWIRAWKICVDLYTCIWRLLTDWFDSYQVATFEQIEDLMYMDAHVLLNLLNELRKIYFIAFSQRV